MTGQSRSAAWFGRDRYTLLPALALLLIALFMPRIHVPRDTFDYVVVFDLTQSMDVPDYEIDGAPVSRLDFARDAVRRALPQLPCGSRIGWGGFAEYRTLLLLEPVEVCSNYNDLLASLDRIDGGMRWSNASEITKGVYWSVRSVRDLSPKPNVVFFTDGQEAPPMLPGTPVAMPDDVKAGQVGGWLVGTGGDTPQRIPHTDSNDQRNGYWRENDVIQFLTPDGKKIATAEHLSALREPHLRAIASYVGFSYTRLTDAASLTSALLDPRFATRIKVPVDLEAIPVGLALLLLIVRFAPVTHLPSSDRARRVRMAGATRAAR